MFELLSGILRWIFSKAFLLTLLWVVGLSLVAGFLFYQHHMAELPEERRVRLEQLMEIDRQISAARTAAVEARREFDRTLQETRTELERKREEVRKAAERLEETARTLESLREWLRRVLDPFDREKREEQRQQLERDQEAVERQRAAAEQAANELNVRIREISVERERALSGFRDEEQALELERAEKLEDVAVVDRAIAQVRAWIEPFELWFRKAWEQAKWQLIGISFLLVFGPLLFKIFKYFVVAPLISQAEPILLPALIGLKDIRLEKEDKGVSVALKLAPGEVLLLKSRFLQASDQDIRKRTQFVFSWRYPFTSVAAGLIELTRIRNTDPDSARSVTISCQSEPEVEMALIQVPEGGSLILRPSMLAAVAYQADARPAIKSHWRFFKLHAWLTLQFRYFEFQGPVMLVVWAWRGVRVEQVNETVGLLKRTNQNSTIGFTPNLEYSCTRAETFWAYLRGWNPLFDDLFRGEGSFLCQEIAGSRRAQRRGRFWESLWNGFTKIFGI